MVWSSIHAPFHLAADLWETGERSEAELAVQIDVIRRAEAFHVPVEVVHPFIGFQPHEPNAAGVENFRRLLDEAGERGVRVAVENVEQISHLDYLMQDLSSHPALGFCLDTGHELCYNGGRDLLASYGSALCYLHINSNTGSHSSPGNPETWHDDAHMLPYDGAVDMDRLVCNLKRIGYNGDLTMELVRRNRPGRNTNDPYLAMTDDEYLALAVKRISRLRTELET